MTLSLILAAAAGIAAIVAATLAGRSADQEDAIPVRIDDRRR